VQGLEVVQEGGFDQVSLLDPVRERIPIDEILRLA
jgi:hypothetical protein